MEGRGLIVICDPDSDEMPEPRLGPVPSEPAHPPLY